jgi:peptide/nickel transport system permease protein
LKTTTGQNPNFKQGTKDTTPRRRVNWPLLAGLALVTLITIIAIVGPSIAPKDPTEELNITMIEGQWYVPPFEIGTPGYPLGSDSFGRDLYSRLLWGIRPTMIMVVIVALVRLVLGVIIGLSAGWFDGKTGRFLNGLIQVALALPVLLVALGAIAIIGVELGIWAFIIGLSLTGWVDTALQVREQTRIVKGQVYVEAANAMGASNQQILSNHILKQITPMLLMLFAFEISSTLMLSAGLGFLGYYIGGDVWVDVDDFVARRISGNPELGQMLATSWVTLTKPWAMVAVGTTIFLTVLGFNLIGEGLRQNIGFTKVQRRSKFAETRKHIGLWIDQNVWHPVIQLFRIKPLRLGLTTIGVFFLLSFGALLMLDAAAQADVSKVLSNYDLTAQSKQDSSQSSTASNPAEASLEKSPTHAITYDPSIIWEFFDESGFSGGPALSINQDQLFFASQTGNVYASDLNGKSIWQVQLSSGGVGTPALDENGNLLIADQSGGLTKLTPQGEILWHYQTEAGDLSHSGPAVGPNGNIYYTVGTSAQGYVQSVSPSGEGLWVTLASTRSFFETPNPGSDGDYVFLKEDIFSTEGGDLIEYDFNLDVRRFFPGQDGLNYLLSGHKTIQWMINGNEIEITDIAEWDSSNFTDFLTPSNVGVNEEGISWQLYTTPGGNTFLLWVSLDDQFLGASEARISSGTLVAMQNDLSAFVCGGGSFNPSSTDCAYLNPDSSDPLWQFHLGNYGQVAGGVVTDNRYFVTTENGYVFEINENLQEINVSTDVGDQILTPTSPADLEISWTYKSSDEITFGIDFGREGFFYIYTDDGKLHILNSIGEVVKVIQLPVRPYHRLSATGRSAPTHISPRVLPDGTIIVVSEEINVYALDSDGNLLWVQELEAEPAELPILDISGNYYLLDLNGGLNSFDKDGLKWRFQSQAANLPAHGFTMGPDKKLYYVVTDYGKGFIQAVSAAGDELWVAQTSTRDFYDDLHLSSDGRFISIAENLFDANNGLTIEYDPTVQIDEFIFGENGQKFLRSVHTVNEWQLGSSGIEVLNEGIVSEEDTTLRPPLGSSADSNGIVWLYYPEKYSGGGIIVVWMTADGDLLGRHLIERNAHSVVAYDMENSLLTECRGFEETQTLECKAYSPTSDEPIWEALLKDNPPFFGGVIEGAHIYLFGEDNSITAVFIGSPKAPSVE